MVNGLDEQHVLINGHGRRYLDAFAFEHLRWCSSACTVAPTKIELFQSENHLYHNLPQVPLILRTRGQKGPMPSLLGATSCYLFLSFRAPGE